MDTETAGDITSNIQAEADLRGWSLIDLSRAMGYYVPPFTDAAALTARELVETAAALEVPVSRLTRKAGA